MAITHRSIVNKKLVNDDPYKLGSEAQRVWPFIAKYCSEILKIYRSTGEVLYRGVKKNPPAVFLAQNRLDRRPVGLRTEKLSSIASSYMEMCGFVPRLKATFCVSDKENASCWGEPYIIFPFDGFQYAWSAEHTGCAVDDYDWPAVFQENYEWFDAWSKNGENRPLIEWLLSSVNFEIPKKVLTKPLAQEFCNINRIMKSGIHTALATYYDIWFAGKYVAIRATSKNYNFIKDNLLTI